MNTQELIDKLESMLVDRPEQEKIFIRLLQQVWEIDWTVAPYDVWRHMVEFDLAYFLEFMGMDEGDEAQEEVLFEDWIATKIKSKSSLSKAQITTLMKELNAVRASLS